MPPSPAAIRIIFRCFSTIRLLDFVQRSSTSIKPCGLLHFLPESTNIELTRAIALSQPPTLSFKFVVVVFTGNSGLLLPYLPRLTTKARWGTPRDVEIAVRE